MTYIELKKQVLALIEELSPKNDALTEDPDIEAKFIYVVNQIMFEVVRIKRLPRYAEIEVENGDVLDFDALSEIFGYDIYQLMKVSGAEHDIRAGSTVIKVLEEGVLEVECYVYPLAISEKNAEKYIFELPPDVLEVMPYGIAADLLKSDVSSGYGSVYANRYEQMLARLDPRWGDTCVCVEGGYDI